MGLRERMWAGALRQPTEGEPSTVRTADGLSELPVLAQKPQATGLKRTIEAEIIPRLVLAHPAATRDPSIPAATTAAARSERIARFADLILTTDPDAAYAHIEALRARGVRLEAIYLDLIIPTASYLRCLWNDDVCDFAEVTLGLWRLQQVVRAFGAAFRSEGGCCETGQRALLLPGLNAKHELPYVMFGLVMIGEFFRRGGWDTWIEPDPSSQDFAAVVRSQWFDVVEFLVSGDKRLDKLASSIREVRRQSPNRAIGVIVSGRVFVENPELVLLVGADMTAIDARQGTLQAQNLVRLLSDRT